MIDIPGLIYISNYLSILEQEYIVKEIESQVWITDLKRRVQHYGYKYDYTKKIINSEMAVPSMPPICQKLANRLFKENIFAVVPDQLIVNEYLPGQGIAPHIDCVPCFDSIIVSLSLLDEYPMTFSFEETKLDIKLEIGSLLSLTGDARYKWKHSIAARNKDGERTRNRRISLTFRNVILNELPDL